MKEPDDSMPFHPRSSQKRPKESAGPSGGLKLATQGPILQPRGAPSPPEPERCPTANYQKSSYRI